MDRGGGRAGAWLKSAGLPGIDETHPMPVSLLQSTRRDFLAALSAGLSLLAVPRALASQAAFSPQVVIEEAAALARRDFTPPERIPEALSRLDYSTYRGIRFRKSEAIWATAPSRFSVELFAPGFLYNEGVDLFLVEEGVALPVAASAATFETPTPEIAALLDRVRRFAGFRVHYPINRDDYADEFIVFQGASYFRAVSRDQRYGLSVRGLAVDVAEPGGEEFPTFRRFWIERPQKGASHVVVHALLDSPSLTGAYHFTVRPGDPTTMDVEATLFPRRTVEHVGLGALTSMFMHGPMDMDSRPDHRPAVHDSLGLAMLTGRGERIWRPLANPRALQIAAFVDQSPKGFGLIQRERSFEAFQDLEARYELRPSAWVRPVGDWGRGHVVLVEIPSDSEANDNIVAYWRPAEPLLEGETYAYSWQVSFPDDVPPPPGLARVIRSAQGMAFESDEREIVIDYAPVPGLDPAGLSLDVTCAPGVLRQATVHVNEITGGLRAAVRFDPSGQPLSEIRVQPKRDDVPVGETWLYRWTAEG
jgi:glucan biosynthesis protein